MNREQLRWGAIDLESLTEAEHPAQERLQRMESALEELKVRQESVTAGKRDQVRVSDSEPEARKMLQTDGGYAPG